MPTLQTVEKFIAKVESNKHDEAIEEFYTSDASMQENQSEPRVGRANLVENERKVLDRVKSMISTCIHPFFIHGDYVVIKWRFRFEWLNGTSTEIEEISYQYWENELIAKEQFFYDPSQRIAK